MILLIMILQKPAKIIIYLMDNIQQNADAVQKGLQLIVRASLQQGSTRLRRLRIELCSDSFHAVLALSCGLAKCQCCVTTVTVVVYLTGKKSLIKTFKIFLCHCVYEVLAQDKYYPTVKGPIKLLSNNMLKRSLIISHLDENRIYRVMQMF